MDTAYFLDSSKIFMHCRTWCKVKYAGPHDSKPGHWFEAVEDEGGLIKGERWYTRTTDIPDYLLPCFEYGGLIFIPFKKLSARLRNIHRLSRIISHSAITPKGYEYKGFYDEAIAVCAGKFDLFIFRNGDKVNVLIPCGKYLFEYNVECLMEEARIVVELNGA